MSLDLNDFRLVINDDFATDTSLNKQLWSDNWGYSSEYSFADGALTLTSLASQYYYPVGFMQATPAKSAGEGYGLYQFSGYGDPGQGKGICFIMWRADNAWLDPANPGKATEMDILESWDGSKTGESTLHWYDAAAASDDGYRTYQLSIDPTKLHTYAMDWERGSLTYYVDGQEIYQDTANVPLDYADGGCNEVMGAQVIYAASTSTTSSVQLHITDMSYSAPAATIAVSAPGTLREALPGAGVTVSETVTTTNLSGSVYDEVLTASGSVESAYQAVTLAANGTASFSAHLAKSGDFIRVVDNATSPTVTANSTPVTITDPSPAATLTGVLPSPLYTGVQTVTGTGGLKGLQLERITQGTYDAPGQSGWVTAIVAANGTWSAQLGFTKAGMLAHVYAENGGSTIVVDLVNGTPAAGGASLKDLVASLQASTASDMIAGMADAAPAYALQPQEPTIIGAASVLLGDPRGQPALSVATDHSASPHA